MTVTLLDNQDPAAVRGWSPSHAAPVRGAADLAVVYTNGAILERQTNTDDWTEVEPAPFSQRWRQLKRVP